MPGFQFIVTEIVSVFLLGAATTFYRVLHHGPLLLLQSDAYYELRVTWQCERDAPPFRDVRHRDALPLQCGAEQHAYDVLLPSYGVLQLSLTCGFLQIGFRASRVPEIHRFY
jgi:hypothetical protein